jgi:hypothetical protein
MLEKRRQLWASMYLAKPFQQSLLPSATRPMSISMTRLTSAETSVRQWLEMSMGVSFDHIDLGSASFDRHIKHMRHQTYFAAAAFVQTLSCVKIQPQRKNRPRHAIGKASRAYVTAPGAARPNYLESQKQKHSAARWQRQARRSHFLSAHIAPGIFRLA